MKGQQHCNPLRPYSGTTILSARSSCGEYGQDQEMYNAQ
jgi:hypothetical protein